MAAEKAERTVNSPARNLVIETMMRSTRNQLLVRGSEKVSATVVASGLSRIQRGQDEFYSKKKKKQLYRETSKGTKVKHGRDYTLIRNKTDFGRDHVSTSSQKKMVKSGARRVVLGRAIPVMAYGFIAYDVMKGNQVPGKNWYGVSESDARYLADNPQIIRNEIAAAPGAFDASINQIATGIQVAIMLGGAIFG